MLLTDYMFSAPIFCRIMCPDKFECIQKILHFTDGLSEDPDDLAKLRGFLEKLRKSFRNNYTLNQKNSVDEYSSLWKGRLKF